MYHSRFAVIIPQFPAIGKRWKAGLFGEAAVVAAAEKRLDKIGKTWYNIINFG